MSWKRYFTPVEQGTGTGNNYSPINGRGQGPGPARSNYSSYLPDVYVGSPNRIERYGQYNVMDNDSEVNADTRCVNTSAGLTRAEFRTVTVELSGLMASATSSSSRSCRLRNFPLALRGSGSSRSQM